MSLQALRKRVRLALPRGAWLTPEQTTLKACLKRLHKQAWQPPTPCRAHTGVTNDSVALTAAGAFGETTESR